MRRLHKTISGEIGDRRKCCDKKGATTLTSMCSQRSYQCRPSQGEKVRDRVERLGTSGHPEGKDSTPLIPKEQIALTHCHFERGQWLRQYPAFMEHSVVEAQEVTLAPLKQRAMLTTDVGDNEEGEQQVRGREFFFFFTVRIEMFFL